MISFKLYREEAVARREAKTGRKHDPEKRGDDAAFERVLINRYKRRLYAIEAHVDFWTEQQSCQK